MVGICQAGVCALTFGNTVIEVTIENAKSMAIAKAAVLYLANFNFSSFSYNLVFGLKKQKTASYPNFLSVSFDLNNLR
jgi:hypothetical protein